MPAADARVVVGCVIDIPPEYDVAEPEIIIERRGEFSLTDALASRHPVEVEHDELDGSVGEVAEEVGSFHAGESSRTLGAMTMNAKVTDAQYTYDEMLALTKILVEQMDENRLFALYTLLANTEQTWVPTDEEAKMIAESAAAAERDFAAGNVYTLEEVKAKLKID